MRRILDTARPPNRDVTGVYGSLFEGPSSDKLSDEGDVHVSAEGGQEDKWAAESGGESSG
jgi:hypothetical protein